MLVAIRVCRSPVVHGHLMLEIVPVAEQRIRIGETRLSGGNGRDAGE
jgi:hypothetical protein